MRRGTAGLAALVALCTLSSCGEGDADAADDPVEPETFEVDGTLTLTDGSSIGYLRRGRAGEECWGEGGYDDIVAGAQVVIRDGDGTKIALGELGGGRFTEDSLSYYAAPCEFAFTIEDVPDEGGVYSVEVSHRGEVSFEQGDEVALTLG